SALPASAEPPPVFGSKALRIELTGTEDALWRFVPRSGAPAHAFAAPVFPLGGKRVAAALSGISRVGDPAVLQNGVFEQTFRGSLREDPSLGLEMRFRFSEDGPILRFQYRLTSTRPHAFSRSGREDELDYLSTSLAGLPKAREVRLSEFVELFHSYTLAERDIPEPAFEARLTATGPIVAATDGKRTLLVAYEHGSQAPDAFVRFDLAPGRRVTLRAAKGSYWRGLVVDPEHPYDTVWMEAGLVAGDLDRTAEAYRGFVRRELSESSETRAPRVHYNTWNYQERNRWWNGKRYLDSMNAERMLAEIDVAARMGIETFVLDTGWYEKTGDWAVSRARFPEGLAPLKARLDAHGMKLGLWFNPTAAAVSSRLGAANAAFRMSWKGESAARPVWETEESYPMCLVSPWGEAFLEALVRLHREAGVTCYKWDAVGQYGCDAPGHGHGTEANRPEERADAYAFRIGPRLAEIAERLAGEVPGAVVDFDVTESGRAVGLAFLTAGRYFLVNNGPYFHSYDVPIDLEKDNWNLFFNKGPARTWITRSTYGYDKWIPANLFLTHYFPDDPESSQLVGVASLILGHDGIWGDLLSVSPEGVARIGKLLGLWRQVRDSIAVASPVRRGAVGGTGEVHEKIEHETGRGAIVVFSTASGRQRYVSEHPVAREHWATPGTTVTFDARGRAIVDASFEAPGAAIV
ncbi:MAG TPA: alpha-galactosidase, partial [Vicinamibacteria bacterium]|nr:alpha-galactosidase [Vicinamibacteria bacterium]